MQEISSIDDLLTGTQQQTSSSQEEAEHDYQEDNGSVPDNSSDIGDDESRGQSDIQEEEKEAEPDSVDDYGNKKPVENEVIRERLKKQAESLERRHKAEIESLRQQLTTNQSPQVKEASKDFEYNPESGDNWQQQLASFIKQTVSSMTHEQQASQQRAREQEIQTQFEDKFRQGMNNFEDYVDVVSSQPITDAMTVATRGMQDPAAFLYAASKKAPQELERISKIPDAYGQIMEMGKLEERLRRTKGTTSAPKPVGRIQEDMSIPHKSDKALSGDELLARSDAKRKNQIQSMRKR